MSIDPDRFFPEEGHRCLPGCGECCSSDFWVAAHEVKNILQWIVDNVGFERLKNQYHLFDTQPGRCPFLTAEKRCLIYPVRPFICRQFGHLEDLRGIPKKIRRRISQKCPKGVRFTTFTASAVRRVFNEWYDLALKGGIFIRAFRNAVVADKEGFKGIIEKETLIKI